MSELFTEQWMNQFQQQWNADTDLVIELARAKFNSTIAYGFKNEAKPRGIIEVSKGKVTSAGNYQDEIVNWDLRADPSVWDEWFSNPPGMMALGMAYTSQKLKFKKGDYVSMIKDPAFAGPFIKSFIVMSRVNK